jgi:DNA topoisomerase-1
MSGTYYKRKVVARKPKYKYKYYGLKNEHEVTDRRLLDELNNIKIPGTYTNVVLTNRPAENGLEATGYDGTGRKQYFYNKKHLAESRKEKYSNLIFLGMNLPKITKDIETLRSKSKPDNDSLNAMALQIMMKCNFRVGSQNNQKKYGTYGLSTLTTEHVRFHKGGATIKFNGKKQQINECFIDDKPTVNMLKKLVTHNKKGGNTDNSGNTRSNYLFSWNGTRVTPDTLNEFLAQYHPDITTKTWRTWFANIRYLNLMRKEDIPESKTLRKRTSNQVVKTVAEELHHTPAICKKNYLMTELTDLYVDDPEKWRNGKKKDDTNLFFTDFLKSHYSISKDWIRKRSISRVRSRSKSLKIGGALGGPTWKPELANHEPGYTGKKGNVEKKPAEKIKKPNGANSYDLERKYILNNKDDTTNDESSQSIDSDSDSYTYDSDSSYESNE